MRTAPTVPDRKAAFDLAERIDSLNLIISDDWSNIAVGSVGSGRTISGLRVSFPDGDERDWPSISRAVSDRSVRAGVDRETTDETRPDVIRVRAKAIRVPAGERGDDFLMGSRPSRLGGGRVVRVSGVYSAGRPYVG